MRACGAMRRCSECDRCFYSARGSGADDGRVPTVEEDLAAGELRLARPETAHSQPPGSHHSHREDCDLVPQPLFLAKCLPSWLPSP